MQVAGYVHFAREQDNPYTLDPATPTPSHLPSESSAEQNVTLPITLVRSSHLRSQGDTEPAGRSSPLSERPNGLYSSGATDLDRSDVRAIAVEDPPQKTKTLREMCTSCIEQSAGAMAVEAALPQGRTAGASLSSALPLRSMPSLQLGRRQSDFSANVRSVRRRHRQCSTHRHVVNVRTPQREKSLHEECLRSVYRGIRSVPRIFNADEFSRKYISMSQPAPYSTLDDSEVYDHFPARGDYNAPRSHRRCFVETTDTTSQTSLFGSAIPAAQPPNPLHVRSATEDDWQKRLRKEERVIAASMTERDRIKFLMPIERTHLLSFFWASVCRCIAYVSTPQIILFRWPLLLALGLLVLIEASIWQAIMLASRVLDTCNPRGAVRLAKSKARSARNYSSYASYAAELDRLCGLDQWKTNLTVTSEVDVDYDPTLIRNRLAELSHLRTALESALPSCNHAAAPYTSTSPHYINFAFCHTPQRGDPLEDCTATSELSVQATLRSPRSSATAQSTKSDITVGDTLLRMITVIKLSLETQLCNSLTPAMFSHTFHGTKQLSHDFHEEVARCLKLLTSIVLSNPQMPRIRRDLFSLIRRLPEDFGQSALAFSGGGILGLHHLGAVQALMAEKVIPSIVAGSSAGSAVAALVATRTDEELEAILQDENQLLQLFASPFRPNNWVYRIMNLVKRGYMVDVVAWLQQSERIVGELTFAEAYAKTKRILNIALSHTSDRTGTRDVTVLNHNNAPNVLIYTAIIASCAFPYLSAPIRLLEKNPATNRISFAAEFQQKFYQDGSLRSDVPTSALRNTWRCKFITVTQVNPHVFPFLNVAATKRPGLPVSPQWRTRACFPGWLFAMVNLVLKEHLRFLLRLMAVLKLPPSPNGLDLAAAISQPYGGDVSIHPSRWYWNHRYVMNNCPPALLGWYLQMGRQMAFPPMALIKARMSIERPLNELRAACRSVASGKG